MDYFNSRGFKNCSFWPSSEWTANSFWLHRKCSTSQEWTCSWRLPCRSWPSCRKNQCRLIPTPTPSCRSFCCIWSTGMQVRVAGWEAAPPRWSLVTRLGGGLGGRLVPLVVGWVTVQVELCCKQFSGSERIPRGSLYLLKKKCENVKSESIRVEDPLIHLMIIPLDPFFWNNFCDSIISKKASLNDVSNITFKNIKTS